ARGNVHGRYERHAVRDAALLHNRRDLVRDAHEFLALLRVEPEVIGEYFQASSSRLPASSSPLPGSLLHSQLAAGSWKLLLEHQRRLRIEIECPCPDCPQSPKTRRADHRSVVGRQRDRW